MLRYILRDWSNTKAIEILKRSREAAVSAKTKVVIIDEVVRYECALSKKIPGAEGIVFEGSNKESEVTAGLLSNLGKAKARNF